MIDKANIIGAKHRMYDRLEELMELKDGWYGHNSYAMEYESADNVRKIIEQVSETVLSQWVLFPNLNGTLVFKRKNRSRFMNFNVANKEYGYVYEDCPNHAIMGRGDASKVFEMVTKFVELTNI